MTEATATGGTQTNDAQAGTDAQSSDSHVTTRIDGAIYYVTLDRPAKRNAITIAMLRDIADAVARADEHPQVRAVIVHGEGRVFSAGIDLNALGDLAAANTGQHPARALRRVAMELQGCLHRIESTELPVIGALHGLVLGLGLELALSFDLRVVGRECQFAFPESRLGLVADVGGVAVWA